MICRRLRHGLTLLEVLIATAILSLLAVTCAPMIARAMTLLRHEHAATTEILDLAEVADAFIVKPEDFGVKDTPLHALDQVLINWPLEAESGLSGAPITILTIHRAADASHHWLEFSCCGIHVHRWVVVPENLRREEREGQMP